MTLIGAGSGGRGSGAQPVTKRTSNKARKRGIYFSDDPAFGGKPREVTAQDFVYTLKRFYDPKHKSPKYSSFAEEKIVGADDLRKKADATGKFDYNSEFCDLYGHYYESQAMMQRGGDEWKQYNDLFRDQLLQNQDADGSWKTPGGGKKPRATAASWQGDKLYRTCLCTLMMEVYYRFLNVGGDNRGKHVF